MKARPSARPRTNSGRRNSGPHLRKVAAPLVAGTSAGDAAAPSASTRQAATSARVRRGLAAASASQGNAA